jgi:hypothetical protein
LVQQQCRVVNEQLKLTVILSGFSGGSYQYSNGVSVFFRGAARATKCRERIMRACGIRPI